MEKRVTPAHIESIGTNQIFVYGTSYTANFWGGTANEARRLGVETNKSRFYPIIIKDENNLTLPLHEIAPQISSLVSFARANPHTQLLVSDFGSGLDGYSTEIMAALFAETVILRNVFLPEKYWPTLLDKPIHRVFKPIADETFCGAESVIDIEEWSEVTKAIIANLENMLETELPTKIQYSYNGKIEAKVFYE